MKYDWQLINDNFSEVDREEVISWLRRNPRLTQGPKVKEFEDAWSEWLGVKHSVFVNSGASANFIMFCIANELKAKEHFKKTGRKADAHSERNHRQTDRQTDRRRWAQTRLTTCIASFTSLHGLGLGCEGRVGLHPHISLACVPSQD